MRLSRSVFVLTTLLCASAGAAELNYKWKAGAKHRFAAESRDVTSMSGMGMNETFTFDLRSTFALVVNKVKPDGTAQATLMIESFEVKDEDGRRLAGLDGIPKGALKNLVEIDKKGNFKFIEEVFLLVDDKGESMLVSTSAKVGKTGGTASAQDGEEKVTLHASFDPKTGKLSAGYTVEKLKQPPAKKKTVAVTQEKAKVDLLPTQFLELLKLPEGELRAGGQTAVKLSQPGIDTNTTVDLTINELTQERARWKTVIASKNQATAPVAPPAKDPVDDEMGGGDMGGGEMGMPGMGMPGMGGMAMPGMGGGGGPGTSPTGGPGVSMSMLVDADFDTDFDLKSGMLSSLGGIMKTSSSVGGMMTIKNESKLTMKRL